MKHSPSNRFLAVSSAVALAAISSSAYAQTSWSGATDGSWATGTNWSADIPDSTDLVTYGAGNGVGIAVTNPTQTLDASREVLGFSVGNNAASPIVISSGTGSNTLTIGTSGILLNSGTGGTLTINADIIMAGAQSFTSGGSAGTQRNITVNNVANGGFLLTVNPAFASTLTTINGVLSGTGGLTKSNVGILTLAGTANTFGGQVSLTGGTTNITKLAIIGTNSSLGTGNGASSLVMNGGTLTYTGAGGDATDRAIDMRAGAAINNNSATGAISFTAANVIQGGAASARTLTLGGSNAGDNTFSSILGNSGTGANISSLQKNGAGKWIVTGTQLYTGATIINAGTLSVSGSTVLGGVASSAADAGNIVFGSGNANGALHFETVANLGAADQIRFRNTGGSSGTGGNLKYIGTTAQVVSKAFQSDSSIGVRLSSDSVGGSVDFSGAWTNVSGNRPIFLGGTGTGINTISGSIANNGSGTLTKVDGGKWILSGNNTYTGATNVNGGTLVIALGGSTAAGSAVAVTNSGSALVVNGTVSGTLNANVSTTLSGSGTVAGAATVSGALNPGTSPGVLSFSNSLSMATTTATTMEINGNTRSTQYDGINVGTALTYGGSLTLAFGNTFGVGSHTFNLFDLFTSQTGSFESVALTGSYTGTLSNNLGVWTTTTNLGNESWSFSQTSGDLSLTVIPEPSSALLGGLGMLLLLRRRR